MCGRVPPPPRLIETIMAAEVSSLRNRCTWLRLIGSLGILVIGWSLVALKQAKRVPITSAIVGD